MPVFIPQLTARSVPPQSVGMTEDQVREILRRADKNKDGHLSKDELKKALKEELGSRMASYRARRCLKNADTNHDGQISDAEFDGLVAYILQWHNDKVKN